MKPHSLGTVSIRDDKKANGGWASRHGNYAKGAALPKTQVLVCPRVRVADLPKDHLKKQHIEHLEHNQLIASCCRHPENHEVEAFKSHPEEPAPDVYVFHCTCGRRHRFFCVGRTDERPVWSAG